MEDFIEFLNENFGKSVEKLAKTSQDNPLFEFDIQMIDLDEMANKIQKTDRKYRGNDFATADALFISNIDDELIFHFIEFKNVDYGVDKDLKMSKYWLEECLSKMNECEHDCFINDETTDVHKSKFHKYLVDRYNVSLRAKPYESISLIDIYFNCSKQFMTMNSPEIIYLTLRKTFIWFPKQTNF